MIDFWIVILIVVVWFSTWHLIYTKLLKGIGIFAVLTIMVHCFLIWLLISLMFYWVYLRSELIFWMINLGVVLQLSYLILRISKYDDQ